MLALDTLPQWAFYTIVGLGSVLTVALVILLLCALRYCNVGKKAKDPPPATRVSQHTHPVRPRPVGQRAKDAPPATRASQQPHPVKSRPRPIQPLKLEDVPIGPLDFEDSYSVEKPRSLIGEARQKRQGQLELPEHEHAPTGHELHGSNATNMQLWWTNKELEAENKRLGAEIAALRSENRGEFLGSPTELVDGDREADKEWAAAEVAYEEAARRLELAKKSPARRPSQAERAPDQAWIAEMALIEENKRMLWALSPASSSQASPCAKTVASRTSTRPSIRSSTGILRHPPYETSFCLDLLRINNNSSQALFSVKSH